MRFSCQDAPETAARRQGLRLHRTFTYSRKTSKKSIGFLILDLFDLASGGKPIKFLAVLPMFPPLTHNCSLYEQTVPQNKAIQKLWSALITLRIQ
jgi:hypothetical protein